MKKLYCLDLLFYFEKWKEGRTFFYGLYIVAVTATVAVEKQRKLNL